MAISSEPTSLVVEKCRCRGFRQEEEQRQKDKSGEPQKLPHGPPPTVKSQYRKMEGPKLCCIASYPFTVMAKLEANGPSAGPQYIAADHADRL